jgi:hypothetical protein
VLSPSSFCEKAYPSLPSWKETLQRSLAGRNTKKEEGKKMESIPDLYIAAAGLISVFAVLSLLYVSMLAMSVLVGKLQSSKGRRPGKKQG